MSKAKQSKKTVVFTIAILLFSIGIAGTFINDANNQKPEYWLGLILIGWCSYNTIAYFLKLSMHFGYGGFLKAEDHSQERFMGLVASIAGVCLLGWYWVQHFLILSE